MSVLMECTECGFTREFGWGKSYDAENPDVAKPSCSECGNTLWRDAF
jgi:hypothetical protein